MGGGRDGRGETRERGRDGKGETREGGKGEGKGGGKGRREKEGEREAGLVCEQGLLLPGLGGGLVGVGQ